MELDFQSARWNYLPSLPRRLDINPDSQILVFSKTSFHPNLFSQPPPSHPLQRHGLGCLHSKQRRSGNISLDPQDGIILYTLSGHRAPQPFFARHGMDCLACHDGAQTLRVPGRLIRSSRMTNLQTRIGWETRIALADKTLTAFSSELNSHIEELVPYMLFANEVPLSEPIQGAPTFSKTFPERGPRDKQERTLREFDLKKRLFRYPSATCYIATPSTGPRHRPASGSISACSTC